MPSKTTKLTNEEVIEREFLPTRSKILELAAALDRIDRAGEFKTDEILMRKELLKEALQLLTETASDNRAEKVQQLFSREYDAGWYEAWIAQTKSEEETA